MRPTIGRIVHYHLIDFGRVVPAVIVDVIDDRVDLFVMTSGRSLQGTRFEEGTFFERNVRQSDGAKPGFWCWPPKV